jgi:hypothetical protein
VLYLAFKKHRKNISLWFTNYKYVGWNVGSLPIFSGFGEKRQKWSGGAMIKGFLLLFSHSALANSLQQAKLI